MDHATEMICETKPSLTTETADDLAHFFERHRDYRRHHGRVAHLWRRLAM